MTYLVSANELRGRGAQAPLRGVGRRESCQRQMHPPIDKVLLIELPARDVAGLRGEGRKARDIGWSKLSSDQYQTLVKQMVAEDAEAN